MILFLIVIWVLGLVSFAGYLWLLILAFKKSTVWGFAVFFIPFVSLYFSLKFWAETKKPFLIHSGASLGLIIVGVVSVFFAASEVQPGESNIQLSQPVMNTKSGIPQKTLRQSEVTSVSLQDLSAQKRRVAAPQSSETRSAQKPQSPHSNFEFARKETPKRYRRTSFVQAKNHIGASIHFTDLQGEGKDCILVKIAEKNLHCRKQFSSGSFSFSYAEKEIKSLKVLR